MAFFSLPEGVCSSIMLLARCKHSRGHYASGRKTLPWRRCPTLLHLENGGTTDAVLAIPAENWASLAAPGTTAPEVMVEVYGEEEASELGTVRLCRSVAV